jgi:hypothetical protein
MSPIAKKLIKPASVLSYFPISFALIGILAYESRLMNPVTSSYAFEDVFPYYANPLQSIFTGIHLPAIVFCFFVLFLLVSVATAPKPLFTLYQIRLILLILLAIMTILVKIFFNVLIIMPYRPASIEECFFIPIFLYVDVHILILYLLTYLPQFRKLNHTLV